MGLNGLFVLQVFFVDNLQLQSNPIHKFSVSAITTEMSSLNSQIIRNILFVGPECEYQIIHTCGNVEDMNMFVKIVCLKRMVSEN